MARYRIKYRVSVDVEAEFDAPDDQSARILASGGEPLRALGPQVQGTVTPGVGHVVVGDVKRAD